MQLSNLNPLVLLVVLVAIVFGFAVADALGAPVPVVNQQLLIGLVVGGLGGSAGAAAWLRRDTGGGGDSRDSAGGRPEPTIGE